MIELSSETRSFFEDLLKYSKRKHNGYFVFQPRTKKYGNTKYKEHRILMQLHMNVILERSELVHHIDGNKLNNSIENLEVVSVSKHTSNHHTGSHKIGRYNPHNKLPNIIQDKIKELAKEYSMRKKKINYSEIGRKLKISGLTVSRYV